MRSTVWIILASVLLAGCSPTLSPFTQELVQDYQFDEEALSQIQFYLSDDIILHRELRQGESTIDQGRISIRDGRRVEEIVFPKGTPGVYLFSPDHQRLAISFERNKDHFLVFGPSKSQRERRGHRGIYRLRAKKWEDRFGIITYGTKEFYTPSRSAFVSLLVDIESKSKVSRRVKEVDGRSVSRFVH